MATSADSTLGRPRLFDEEAVLNELVGLFWRQGYAQTSMADIVDASGVHKPSLYRTFGTKEELFATVLRRYLTEREAVLNELIAACRPGIVGVHDFLDKIEADALTDAGQYGCLFVNSATELRGSAPGFENFAGEYRAVIRRKIRSLVERVQPASDNLVDLRADLLYALVLGYRVIIRSSADPEEARATMVAIHAAVDAWQA